MILAVITARPDRAGILITVLLNNALCLQRAEKWLRLKCFPVFNGLPPNVWPFLKNPKEWPPSFCQPFTQRSGIDGHEPRCRLSSTDAALSASMGSGGHHRKLPAVFAAGARGLASPQSFSDSSPGNVRSGRQYPRWFLLCSFGKCSCRCCEQMRRDETAGRQHEDVE